VSAASTTRLPVIRPERVAAPVPAADDDDAAMRDRVLLRDLIGGPASFVQPRTTWSRHVSASRGPTVVVTALIVSRGDSNDEPGAPLRRLRLRVESDPARQLENSLQNDDCGGSEDELASASQ
jgi:hypothetical protein